MDADGLQKSAGQVLQDGFARTTQKIITGCIEMAALGRIAQRMTINEQCVVYVVQDHVKENPDFFESTCEELQLTPTNYNSKILQVMKSIFDDKEINWGRIIALLSFCQSACVHSQKIGLPPSAIDSMVPWATMFICTHLKEWIILQGGWESFPRGRKERKSSQTPQHKSVSRTVSNTSGWIEQGFKGIAFGITLLDAIR